MTKIRIKSNQEKEKIVNQKLRDWTLKFLDKCKNSGFWNEVRKDKQITKIWNNWFKEFGIGFRILTN